MAGRCVLLVYMKHPSYIAGIVVHLVLQMHQTLQNIRHFAIIALLQLYPLMQKRDMVLNLINLKYSKYALDVLLKWQRVYAICEIYHVQISLLTLFTNRKQKKKKKIIASMVVFLRLVK